MNAMDRILGASADVLSIRARRMELISANLANADTPGYKAVDIDFRQALQRARDDRPVKSTLRPGHIDFEGASPGNAAILYRTPAQVSIDGNSVETDQEHAAFMDNAIRYQASLNFLDSRLKSVVAALRGE